MTRDSGEMRGAALQPRRLAVLAAIAVAGDRGLSRDKLLGLFWPDAETARARQALSQALYALRKDTGTDKLVTGTTVLRLDESAITSDVVDFERALAAGERERAAEAYAGPFLDGIFLSDAPEFEHWADGERLRLAQQAERAISALATDAGARNDHDAAARWWRRLAVLDPLQTRAALGVIAAAAAAGDRAGALRHAEAYARRVRDDLGVEPSARVKELADSLRASRDAAREDGSARQRYDIQREIGQGGMAVVYLARDRKHERNVALKMLRPEVGTIIGPDRLQREIMVTAGLQHPHILPLYDSGDIDGTLFYVMPFVDGESLRARLLREHRLSLDDTVSLATEIAGALDHAHRHGVVHRDIKPENILLADGHAIVADFGIAKAMAVGLDAQRGQTGALTQVGTALGTPAYMSPEQVTGDDDVGPASDVFSLACVVFEMLTGRPPWIAANAQALMTRRFVEPAPLLSTVLRDAPPELDAALQRALAVDPAARTTGAVEFARALREAVAHGPRPLTGRPRLPALAGALIGREREMEVALGLLQRENVALLTLTGAGGSGKTRLALQLASAATTRFDDVHFVDLTALTNPSAVLPALAEPLGVRDQGERNIAELLARQLAGRKTLVVLDNVEHVIACAPDVAKLLAAVPMLTVLATSRMRLGVRGEHESLVAPLAVPPRVDDAGIDTLRASPAVRLFLERARQAQPSLPDDDDTVRTAAHICARLDGLPLAIELTAARCRVLSPRALLGRLESSFAILAGGTRDMPERHRTMRQTVAWSYDLLSEADRELFAYLSTFSGGCTLEAAEAVCASPGIDVLAGIESLVDASLLLRVDTDSGEPRLRMMEAVRQFAAEMLATIPARDEIVRRHAAWALAFAQDASSRLLGAEQNRALAALALEHANLHVALERSLDAEDADAALRFGAALWRYWLIRSPLGEARALLERILSSLGAAAPTGLRADVLSGAGQIAQNSGAVRDAQRYFDGALSIRRALGDDVGIARAYTELGWLAWRRCDYDESRRLSQEALALARRAGDERIAGLALGNIGFGHVCQGNFSAARAAFEESLAIRRALDDARGIAFVRSAIAWTLCREGALERVGPLLDECLTSLQQLGDQRLVAWVHNVRGELLLRSGDAEGARQVLESHAMPIVRRVADRWALAHALATRAWVAIQLGDVEGAARFASEAYDLRAAIEDRWGMAEIHALRARVARVQGRDADAAALLALSRELRVEMGDRAGLAECDRALAQAGSAVPA